MSEAGWISIVSLIMGGIGTMFSAWILLRQKQLDQKVALVTEKTEDVAKNVGETKEMVDGQMSAFKAMMRELMAEKVVSAHAIGKSEAQESDMIRRQEIEDAAQKVRDTATIAAQELKTVTTAIPVAPAPATQLTLTPASQDVELNVAGTLTPVKKDAQEKPTNTK